MSTLRVDAGARTVGYSMRSSASRTGNWPGEFVESTLQHEIEASGGGNMAKACGHGMRWAESQTRRRTLSSHSNLKTSDGHGDPAAYQWMTGGWIPATVAVQHIEEAGRHLAFASEGTDNRDYRFMDWTLSTSAQWSAKGSW